MHFGRRFGTKLGGVLLFRKRLSGAHLAPVSLWLRGAFWTSFRHEIRWCFGAKEARFRKGKVEAGSRPAAAAGAEAAAAAAAGVDRRMQH